MYQDRGIVCKYRLSDGLSMISDDQNTLTRQSADVNDAPREPLHSPITYIIRRKVKEGNLNIKAVKIINHVTGWF